MRYNPATDNAIENERAQARHQRLTLAKEPQAVAPSRIDWAGLKATELHCAKLGLSYNHTLANCATLSHDMVVAEAMGNWPEVRRLRAQLIAGLW